MKLIEGTRDYQEFHRDLRPEKMPFDREKSELVWEKECSKIGAVESADLSRISLCGEWKLKMADTGVSPQDFLGNPKAWNDAITASVPCSIQTALFEAGCIDDPMLMKNNLDIEWVAQKKWWLKRVFKVPSKYKGKDIELTFEGVDYKATFWLNGAKLGEHEGMFGGPEFDVQGLLNYGETENVLIVSIDPAPVPEKRSNFDMTFGNFKTSVVYGWHYVKLVSLGIWQPVYLKVKGDVSFIAPPFITTSKLNGERATVDTLLQLVNRRQDPTQVVIELQLWPKNFSGTAFVRRLELTLEPGVNEFCFTSDVEGVQIWWPFSMGFPNLYSFKAVVRVGDEASDRYVSNFGFRIIEMVPNSDGPSSEIYNWQFVINGRKNWVKGANWCSPDPLLRFDKKRYERYLVLAKNANIELLRVWGGGPIETSEFYDFCDEFGIMVWQEFPLLGTSLADDIPLELADDISNHVVPRYRNRPSLAVWCGGNELLYPGFLPLNGEGNILRYLGRKCMELDGTRPYRITCPYAGDTHWYGVYWGEEPIESYSKAIDDINVTQPPGREGIKKGPIAFTEWGLSSPANYETWEKVLSQDEIQCWPLKRDGEFVHHTPTFDPVHIDKMIKYAEEFKPVGGLQDMITGMQIAQGIGFKYVIERMRAGKPYTTATYIYKYTENYPACSWAAVDYYCVPKISYYYTKNAYSPIHGMVLFTQWNMEDGRLPVQIYAVNDSPNDRSVEFRYRVLDDEFQCVQEETLFLEIPVDRSLKVRDLILDNPRLVEGVFFIVTDIMSEEQPVDRNWYCFNFKGCSHKLWEMQRADVKCEIQKDGNDYCLFLENIGNIPAVGLHISLGKASNTYYVQDSNLWIGSGEEIRLVVQMVDPVDGDIQEFCGVEVSGYNVERVVVQLTE